MNRYRLRIESRDAGTSGHGPWVSGLGVLEALQEHKEFLEADPRFANTSIEIESDEAVPA